MAKTFGAGHSDGIRGKVGGITYRGHGGLNVVSGSKTYFRRKPIDRGSWSPEDEGNLQFWHRMPDECTFRVAGAQTFISGWGCKKSSGRDYIQAVNNEQPEYHGGGSQWGGRPWAEFDGLNDWMLSLVFPVTIPHPAMLFLVASEPSDLLLRRQIMGWNSSSPRGCRYETGALFRYEMNMQTISKCGVAGDGKVKLWSFMINGATSSMRWNNVQQSVPGNIGNQPINQISLGRSTTGSNPSAIKVFEDFCISGSLSETTMRLAWGYASKRYNL